MSRQILYIKISHIYEIYTSMSIPITLGALRSLRCTIRSRTRLSAMRYGPIPPRTTRRSASEKLFPFAMMQPLTLPFPQSSEIIRMFYTEFNDLLPPKYASIDLFPEHLRADIEATNEWTYNDINNGVYKSGFATTQEAYEKAVYPLFTSLDRAEAHLASQSQKGEKGPYYYDAHITEADVRLFTTIIRFDPVYVQHFKCNVRDIRSGYPYLHKWARNLYWNVGAFGKETTVFEHIKKHYTKSHRQINQSVSILFSPQFCGFPDG